MAGLKLSPPERPLCTRPLADGAEHIATASEMCSRSCKHLPQDYLRRAISFEAQSSKAASITTISKCSARHLFKPIGSKRLLRDILA